MQEHQAPITWLQHIISALQWPVIVVAAFWLGRYVNRIETRAINAEKNVKDVVERHFPHVHRALAAMTGKLDTIQALLQKGKG